MLMQPQGQQQTWTITRMHLWSIGRGQLPVTEAGLSIAAIPFNHFLPITKPPNDWDKNPSHERRNKKRKQKKRKNKTTLLRLHYHVGVPDPPKSVGHPICVCFFQKWVEGNWKIKICPCFGHPYRVTGNPYITVIIFPRINFGITLHSLYRQHFSVELIFNFGLRHIVLTATLKLQFLFTLHYIRDSGSELIMRYITLRLR